MTVTGQITVKGFDLTEERGSNYGSSFGVDERTIMERLRQVLQPQSDVVSEDMIRILRNFEGEELVVAFFLYGNMLSRGEFRD